MLPRTKYQPRRTSPHNARLCICLLTLCVSTATEAHDFWLQPDAFWLTPQTAMPLTLQVGHGPSRQRSPMPLSRITRFAAMAPDGVLVDLREHLHPGGPADDGTFQFDAPGTYVLVLETDAKAQSHLPASRFNDYLTAEGVTPALQKRATTQRMDAEGSERYSRRAKAIIQVGTPDARAPSQITEALGLPLEIVPEANPYASPRSATLPVRVMYKNAPLAGALVKFTDLDNDREPLETRLTDAGGRARFTMPARGRWLLNVIWTEALPIGSDTDFETIFSSVSFGFPTDRRDDR